MNDKRYMARALELAIRGYGFVNPNPMVGCVIVHPKKGIVGEGWHREFGGPHAEVNAVQNMADKSLLPECTVYVTLEPCAHKGKTPPCADMLIEAGARKVVIGSKDPFIKVKGKGIERLRSAGVEVKTGVLRAECDKLNEKFITAHTKQRPYVMLKWAQTGDGFIALHGGRPVQISNRVSLVWMHRLRAGFDAIMIGTNTVLSDNPHLDVRLWPHRVNPRPVILDIHGRVRAAAKTRRINVLENPNTVVIEQKQAIPDMLAMLYRDHGITSVLVEGGTQILESFLVSGMYDAVRMEVAKSTIGQGLKAPMSVAPRGVVEGPYLIRGNSIWYWRK